MENKKKSSLASKLFDKIKGLGKTLVTHNELEDKKKMNEYDEENYNAFKSKFPETGSVSKELLKKKQVKK